MVDISSNLQKEISVLTGAVTTLARTVTTAADTFRSVDAPATDTARLFEFMGNQMEKNNAFMEQQRIKEERDEKARRKAKKEERKAQKAHNKAMEEINNMGYLEARRKIKNEQKVEKQRQKHIEAELTRAKMLGSLTVKQIRAKEVQLRQLSEEIKHKDKWLKQNSKINKAIDAVTGKMAELAQSKVGKTMAKLTGALAGVLGGAALGASLLKIIGESESAFKNIAKASGVSIGAAQGIRDEMQASAHSLALAGFSLEQQGEIATSLVKSFGKLSSINATNMKLVGDISKSMGMSVDEAAGAFKTMTLNLGLSTAAAREFGDSIRKEAVAAGVNASLVFRDITNYAQSTNKALLLTPEKLKQAAIRARQLGTTLEEGADAAKNFETLEGSINIAQKAAVAFGAKLNAVELTRLARAGKHTELREKLLDSMKEQIDANGNILTTDVAQIEVLEEMFGKSYPAIIKSMKQQEKLQAMGVKDDTRRAAILAVMAREQVELAKMDQAALTEHKAAIDQEEKRLKISNTMADATKEYQNTMERISNIIKAAILPFLSRVEEAMTSVFGLSEGSADELGTLSKKVENALPSVETMKEVFEGIKTAVIFIKDALKWAFENPMLAALIGVVGGVGVAKAATLGMTAATAMWVQMSAAGAGWFSKGIEKLKESRVGQAASNVTTKATNLAEKGVSEGAEKAAKGGVINKVSGWFTKTLKGAPLKILGNLKTIFGGVIGKGFVKKLPFLGLLFSLYDMYNRIKKGDYLGAGLEFIAAVAALFPGVGTGISVAISGANAMRDLSDGGAGTTEEAIEAAQGAAGKSIRGLNILPFSKGGRIPKSGKRVTKPTLAAIGETGEDEIIIPTERLRNGGPVDPQVKKELRSIPPENLGQPQIFANMGFSSGGSSGASVEAAAAAKSREKAATALELAAGDFLAAEMRLGKGIRHTTEMQEAQANLQVKLNQEQLAKERKKFSIDNKLLDAIGKHMVATESFINENDEMMAAMGGMGSFLQNNAKLIGDVGRFLQVSDKKSAAIGMAATVLTSSLDKMLLGSGKDGKGPSEFAKAVSLGMNEGMNKFAEQLQSGADPMVAGLRGVGAALRAGHIQKQKELEIQKRVEKNTQIYNDSLKALMDAGLSEEEAKKTLAEKLVGSADGMQILTDATGKQTEATEANTEAQPGAEKPKDPFIDAFDKVSARYLGSSGPLGLNLKNIGTDLKEGAKLQAADFADGTAALMESGMSLKEAAKTQAKKQAKELGKKALDKGADVAIGALATAAGPFAPLVTMMAPILKQFIPKIIGWLAKNWKKLPGMIVKIFKKLPGLILKGLKLLFKIHIFIIKAIISILGKVFKMLPKLLIGAVIFAIAGPFILIVAAVRKFFPNLFKKLIGFIKGAFKLYLKIVTFIPLKIWAAVKAIFGFLGKIRGWFIGVLKKIVKSITSIPGKLIRAVKKIFGKLKFWSEGTVATKPTTGMIAETGEKEMVVPIDRIKNGGKVNPEVVHELNKLAPYIGGAGGGEAAGGSGGFSMGGGGSNEALINEIRALRSEISALAERPININMDGKKVADVVGERFQRMASGY